MAIKEVMVSILHVSLLLAFLSGCVSDSINRSTGKKESIESRDQSGFDLQVRCYEGWYALLERWKEKGGGIKRTMRETRELSISNVDSEFSNSVKHIWHKQNRQSGKIKFGEWPINKDHFDEVMKKTLGEFSKYTPSMCSSVTWFGSVVWNSVMVDEAGEISNDFLVDMPREIRDDPSNASRWMLFWIFVKPD